MYGSVYWFRGDCLDLFAEYLLAGWLQKLGVLIDGLMTTALGKIFGSSLVFGEDCILRRCTWGRLHKVPGYICLEKGRELYCRLHSFEV